MALVAVELETLVSEPDALTTRPPPFTQEVKFSSFLQTSIAKARCFQSFIIFLNLLVKRYNNDLKVEVTVVSLK